jgi:hypothetical protein
VGTEFRVNSYTTGSQTDPAVDSDASGNFVVVWTAMHPDFTSDIVGQRYASSGIPLGAEFLVNTYTTGSQFGPAVASDPFGDFVVVWTSAHQEALGYDVLGQRFSSAGSPVGPEFRVNTYTTNSQYRPAVAADASGNYVVVWQSLLQDGSNTGVFGRSGTAARVLRLARSSASTPIRRPIRAFPHWPWTPPETSLSSGTVSSKTARSPASSGNDTTARARP